MSNRNSNQWNHLLCLYNFCPCIKYNNLLLISFMNVPSLCFNMSCLNILFQQEIRFLSADSLWFHWLHLLAVQSFKLFVFPSVHLPLSLYDCLHPNLYKYFSFRETLFSLYAHTTTVKIKIFPHMPAQVTMTMMISCLAYKRKSVFLHAEWLLLVLSQTAIEAVHE